MDNFGYGAQTTDKHSPVQIATGVWKQIAAGYNHTILLSENKLLMFGLNNYGQLGIENLVTNDISSKFKIDGMPVKIVQVAAGASHSVAIDEFGNVWSWGKNGDGELGTYPHGGGTTPLKVLEPVRIPNCAFYF